MTGDQLRDYFEEALPRLGVLGGSPMQIHTHDEYGIVLQNHSVAILLDYDPWDRFIYTRYMPLASYARYQARQKALQIYDSSDDPSWYLVDRGAHLHWKYQSEQDATRWLDLFVDGLLTVGVDILRGKAFGQAPPRQA